MLLNSGKDLVADALGDTTGHTGTSASGGSAPTATTLTDSGASWTTDQWKGHVVATGSVYGVISSNTATELTVDKWYTPSSPGGAAASTPSGGIVYVIVAGNQPAFWIALTTNSDAPSAGDTSLASELSTNGLARKAATYAHTDSTAVYTLTATWTCSGGTQTINKIGIFNQSASGRMTYETAVSSAPTLINGDQLTVTDTITIS